MNRPYIVCHMVSSIDGRIDCDMTEQIEPGDEYYDVLARLECPSLLMGRITMQMHYADSIPFKPTDSTPIGREAVHCSRKATKFTIAIDTHGRLRWPENEFDGALLVITSQSAPEEYAKTLSSQGVSWIATGTDSIDLKRAMELLREYFGVTRLALTGGGHINGAFINAGLVDEISLLVAPGIDGRKGMPTVFDGIDNPVKAPTHLHLLSVENIGNGVVWLRYTPIYSS